MVFSTDLVIIHDVTEEKENSSERCSRGTGTNFSTNKWDWQPAGQNLLVDFSAKVLAQLKCLFLSSAYSELI